MLNCRLPRENIRIFNDQICNIIKRLRETGEISVRKGQDQRHLLDPCGLQALRRHCITHRHDSVIDITKWAQEYFQKPLMVNTIRRAICKCQLKLYHAKRKPYVNMVQKRRHVLWAKDHLQWTVSKWKSVLCSPPDNVYFREGLVYFSRTMQNHILQLLQQRGFVVEESGCRIGLPAVQGPHL